MKLSRNLLLFSSVYVYQFLACFTVKYIPILTIFYAVTLIIFAIISKSYSLSRRLSHFVVLLLAPLLISILSTRNINEYFLYDAIQLFPIIPLMLYIIITKQKQPQVAVIDEIIRIYAFALTVLLPLSMVIFASQGYTIQSVFQYSSTLARFNFSTLNGMNLFAPVSMVGYSLYMLPFTGSLSYCNRIVVFFAGFYSSLFGIITSTRSLLLQLFAYLYFIPGRYRILKWLLVIALILLIFVLVQTSSRSFTSIGDFLSFSNRDQELFSLLKELSPTELIFGRGLAGAKSYSYDFIGGLYMMHTSVGYYILKSGLLGLLFSAIPFGILFYSFWYRRELSGIAMLLLYLLFGTYGFNSSNAFFWLMAFALYDDV